MTAVADPGFPVGGVGGADLRHGCFLAKTYLKTKELDPIEVGGGGVGPTALPLDLPMDSNPP